MRNFLHTLLRYTRKALTLPPHVVAKKALRKVRAVLGVRQLRLQALHSPLPPVKASFGPPLLEAPELLPVSHPELSILQELVPFWLAHRFDLLGSGWVKWDGAGPFPGVAKHTYDTPLLDALDTLPEVHRAACRQLRAQIAPLEYCHIDWQRDVKSGFRFDDGSWHLDQPIGTMKGSDIKLPWEIGRLQHLPQMAVAAQACLHNDPERASRLKAEYQAQILDFLAANPVCVGAQWTCTMDVGIRAANLVLARELFHSVAAKEEDSAFDCELAGALLRHGRFIVRHLEWSETLTSNHYLADICGLVFVAAALESTPETDGWLAFACDQAVTEFSKQFLTDGANFEASTSYHRLSLEMGILTFAVICGLPLERLKQLAKSRTHYMPKEPVLSPQWAPRLDNALASGLARELIPGGLWERLMRAGIVSATVTKPDGNLCQIGDNDSGRFLRVTVSGDWLLPEDAEARYANLDGYVDRIAPYRFEGERYFDENLLDHRGVLGLAAGFAVPENTVFSSGFAFETALVKSLSRGKGPTLTAPDCLVPRLCPAGKRTFPHSREITLYTATKESSPLTRGGVWTHFPEAGWHIYASSRVFLCINGGGNGQKGNGGHAHNDRLTVELQVDGRDVLRDPGTGLYTPSATTRNRYRSSLAHNGPTPAGAEQNAFTPDGIFWMPDETKTLFCECGAGHIALELQLRQGICHRKVSIRDYEITLTDSADFQMEELNLQEAVASFSPGYGKIVKPSRTG